MEDFKWIGVPQMFVSRQTMRS